MHLVRVKGGSLLSDRPQSLELDGDGWLVASKDAHLYFRRLDFDTQTLGLRCARIDAWELPDHDGGQFLDRALGLAAQHVDHATWKIPSEDQAACGLARAAGFHQAAVTVSFEGELATGGGADPRIRQAAHEDREPLIRLCAEVFHAGTRFHRDPAFPAERIPGLYGQWMRNSLDGYADMVLVGGGQGVEGFVTAQRQGPAVFVDLLGVARAARRSGLARALVHALVRAYGPAGVRLKVGTEADNIAATAFYAGLGLTRGASTDVYQKGLGKQP